MNRSSIASILIVVASTLATLLAVEGIGRIVMPRILDRSADSSDTRQDPELGWLYREGVQKSSEAGGSPMTFWSDGARVSGAKQPTAADILLTGGSFMQGYSVDDEKAIGWLLNERFPDYALENVATGGYGTYQSWLSAKRYFETLESPPKVVVYGFNYLHLARNVQTYAWFEAANRGAKIRHVIPHVTLDSEGELVRHAAHEIAD